MIRLTRGVLRPGHVVLACVLIWSRALPAQEAAPGAPYFPPRGEWTKREPGQVGMDAERLAAAVEFAKKSASRAPRDLARYIRSTLANEPHGEIVGPTPRRGDTNGLVVRRGYIVAEWGPTRRADMTFSVSKTYLSTVVGLAVDRKIIRDVHEPARDYVPTNHFAGDHNGKITWDHLLRQTSDWRGSLWTKPAWADRPPRGATEEEMKAVPLEEPGEAWEYNDVRVNLLALCALHVWREPLPVILRRLVMDPIGASNTWRWYGYKTSWITLDGQRMQSVSGGGHWGGGMVVSTRDQARFGYLFLRGGRWGERRIVTENWIAAARTPTKPRPTYGYMNWFLNTKGRRGRPLPAAPASAVTFRGAGSNIVYIDQENDVLIVVRWFDRRAMNGLVERVLGAIR